MQHGSTNLLLHSSNQKGALDQLKKYKSILWKRKYWILGITFAISIIWIFVYFLFFDKASEYTSTVTVKFEDQKYRTIGALTEFAQYGAEGKVAVLYTNSFLSSVVDSLELNIHLKTEGINRFDFFKSIKISEKAKYGTYVIRNEKNKIKVYYTDPEENEENKNILTVDQPASPDLKIYCNGLKLTLNAEILKQYKEVEFSYTMTLITVSNLKRKLQGTLDRSSTILNISFTYTNPEAVALITNTIANLYIDKLLEHKRFQTSSVLKSFEDQLVAADEELKKSEEALRKFREGNPYLLLSNAGTNIVANLSQGRGALSTVDNKINRLSNLLDQKNSAEFEKKSLAYSELLSFWESENGVSGQTSVLSPQYNALLTERARLLASNYTADHPRVLETETKIKNFQSEIDSRITQYLNQLKSNRYQVQRNLNANRSNLRKLPEGELRLAELEQDKEVKARIYSNILVRYNEAKIADASIIPDAFIIDHAEVPIVYSTLFEKLIFIALGPILGIIIAIGIFILLDYFDFTVKESNEVESRLKLPVLVSIPVIIDEEEFPNEFDIQKQMDPKLITSDYAPSIAGEKFRVVRTRLLTELGDGKKSLIITSLSPGDGKSLISSNLAITFAQQKLSTLIIDADLRRGVLHNSFNCSKKPGLADILLSSVSINGRGLSRFVQRTHVPNLSLISSGIQVPNPSELLGSERMKYLIKGLEDKFSIIIFDTPPIEFIPDMLVLNSFIHNILFVARYGKTNLNRLSTKLSEIASLKNDFLGIVINATSSPEEKDQYSYSYYHY